MFNANGEVVRSGDGATWLTLPQMTNEAIHRYQQEIAQQQQYQMLQQRARSGTSSLPPTAPAPQANLSFFNNQTHALPTGHQPVATNNGSSSAETTQSSWAAKEQTEDELASWLDFD
jgi:hypothetical protein